MHNMLVSSSYIMSLRFLQSFLPSENVEINRKIHDLSYQAFSNEYSIMLLTAVVANFQLILFF